MFSDEFNTVGKVVMKFWSFLTTVLRLKIRSTLVVIAERRSLRPPLSTFDPLATRDQGIMQYSMDRQETFCVKSCLQGRSLWFDLTFLSGKCHFFDLGGFTRANWLSADEREEVTVLLYRPESLVDCD